MAKTATVVMAAAGALCAGAPGAGAYEFRARWVERIGEIDVELAGNTIRVEPGSNHRFRLQFGVFDDAAEPAPLGYAGWRDGVLTASGGTSTRTLGRLRPFNFAPNPPGNGLPSADPWMSLTEIDNTIGTQTHVWNGIPGTNLPGPIPEPTNYGHNEFISTYEITFVADVASYNVITITASGSLWAVTDWLVCGCLMGPDPGPDGIFGPGDHNMDGIPDEADDVPEYVLFGPRTDTPRPLGDLALTITVGCAADFNNDNSVNSQDFFDFLSCFLAPGACPPGAADFNGDGAVDSQDFFDYLAAFLAGCG